MADLMWLRDWTLVISNEPPDGDAGDAIAAIAPTEGRRHAVLFFSDGFLAESNESSQRQTVTHELLHLHFEAAARLAERAMGRRWEDFRLMLEYGIDATADAFAERMPLPSHVKAKRK